MYHMAHRIFKLRVTYASSPDDPAMIDLGERHTLADLHLAIQDAFDWDADHPYSFFMSGKAWDRTSEYAAVSDGSPDERLAKQASLANLELSVGATFLYLFDYGDEHHFTVRVEQIEERDKALREPQIVQSPTHPPRQYPDEEDWDDEADAFEDGDEDDEFDLETAPLDASDLVWGDRDWGGDGSDPERPVRAHVLLALTPSAGPYPPPVDELLRLGEPDRTGNKTEAQIAKLGLTQAHVPDLVRMARDRDLNTAMSNTTEVWAPTHALEALQNLDASAVVADLVPLLDIDDDWNDTSLGAIMSNAGAPALEPLRHYLLDRTHWVPGRARAAEILGKVGVANPELQDQVVEILNDVLRRADTEQVWVNSSVIDAFMDLNAVESLPLMRRAFELGAVDEMVHGDWSTVLAEFGQEPEPGDPLVEQSTRRWEQSQASLRASLTGRPEPSLPPPPSAAPAPSPSSGAKKASKKKSKRKMEAASRKANKTKKKKRK
jgi:hypothetical protein